MALRDYPRGSLNLGQALAAVDRELARITPHTHLFDAFDRADTVAGVLGTAPSGRTWLLTGAGAGTAKITGGRYVSGTPGTDQNVYAYQTLPYPVRAARATVSWASVTDPQVIALVSSKYPDTGFADDLIHLIIGPFSVTLQKFVGAVATTIHTVLLNLEADTSYEFGWEIAGDTVTVDYPGGSFAVSSSDFPDIQGRTAYYQIFDTAISTGAVRFEWVEAFAAES